MKQVLFKSVSVLLALVMLNIPSFALSLISNANLSSNEIKAISEFDESEVYTAFDGLNQLDQYLKTNADQSYLDVSKENVSILSGVSSTASLPLTSPANNDLALGIPSFLWGCVFGVIGLLIVYIATDNNKEQVKKALTGCAVGTLVSIGLYVLLIAGATAASTTTY